MSRKQDNTGLKILLIFLIVCFLAATGFLIKLSLDLPNAPSQTRPAGTGTVLPQQPQPTATQAPTTEATQPQTEHVVSTATISVQGDLLMHKPIFADNSIIAQRGMDFSPIFQYTRDLIQGYDFAIANLETTFGGDSFPYQGNPSFNCPDQFLDSIVDSGYDMLLTANNHSYDTQMTGITRTLEKVRGAGLKTLGSRMNEEEKRYDIVEVNGIRIGMICYTYSSGLSEDGRPRLNGNSPMEKPALINWFYNRNPEKMYGEVKQILEDMRREGVDVTMMFLHWGEEYQLTQNYLQNAQSQALCDLGIDVLVGGHPHVVQPVALLTSATDPDHKTICFYSMGNAVSNQRSGNIPACSTPHTEDGILVEVTFEKYSDGTVYVQSADVLPTWVTLHRQNGGNEYNIIPLDKSREDSWQTDFHLDSNTFGAAQRSWDRTMKIVGQGLEQVQTWLSQEKQAREAHYLELVS